MPLPHRTDLPPVRTPEDAARRWRDLLATTPPPDGELWVQVLDEEGRQHPSLVVVEELPPRPDAVFLAEFLENLLLVLQELLASAATGVGAIAVALTRPAPPGVHAGDLGWVDGLLRAARRHGVRVLAVHLVVDGRVEALA